METEYRQARKARMACPADSRLLHPWPHKANEALEGATGWFPNAQPAKGMGPVSVPSYSAFMRCALNLPMGAHRSSDARVAACVAQLQLIPGRRQSWRVSSRQDSGRAWACRGPRAPTRPPAPRGWTTPWSYSVTSVLVSEHAHAQRSQQHCLSQGQRLRIVAGEVGCGLGLG